MSDTLALAKFLEISRNDSFVGSKGKMLCRFTSLALETDVRNWLAERHSQLSSGNSPQATHLVLWCVGQLWNGTVKPVEIVSPF